MALDMAELQLLDSDGVEGQCLNELADEQDMIWNHLAALTFTDQDDAEFFLQNHLGMELHIVADSLIGELVDPSNVAKFAFTEAGIEYLMAQPEVTLEAVSESVWNRTRMVMLRLRELVNDDYRREAFGPDVEEGLWTVAFSHSGQAKWMLSQMGVPEDLLVLDDSNRLWLEFKGKEPMSALERDGTNTAFWRLTMEAAAALSKLTPVIDHRFPKED